jgi:hypothetical protein
MMFRCKQNQGNNPGSTALAKNGKACVMAVREKQRGTRLPDYCSSYYFTAAAPTLVHCFKRKRNLHFVGMYKPLEQRVVCT